MMPDETPFSSMFKEEVKEETTRRSLLHPSLAAKHQVPLRLQPGRRREGACLVSSGTDDDEQVCLDLDRAIYHGDNSG